MKLIRFGFQYIDNSHISILFLYDSNLIESGKFRNSFCDRRNIFSSRIDLG